MSGRNARAGRVQRWRHVQQTGALPDGDDPTAAAADLAAHWAQRLVVALDLALETEPPGQERLGQVLTVWLDLSRSTPDVRRVLAGQPPAAAVHARTRRTVRQLLTEDLSATGAADPARSAAALLRELDLVVAREDVAGRPLRQQRAALLGSPPPAARRWLRSRRRHTVPA